MNATVLDLRYHMKKVLQALNNRESVQVLYHGKVKGVIMPVGGSTQKTVDHDFFGCEKTGGSVAEEMSILRGGRHRDI